MLNSTYFCSDKGFIFPIVNESTFLLPVRAFLYLLGLLWSFMGVAIVADLFMCSIEKITSKTKKIAYYNQFTQETKEAELKVWNDTVANLTLMALGSSAPEILLSIIEIMGKNFKAGDLGPGTIVGSAAFNLLVIIGVCIAAVGDEAKRIKSIKVFFVTAFCCVFAYVWLTVILVGITPDYVDLWEGVLTFMFFPLMVLIAYMMDIDLCRPKNKIAMSEEELAIGLDVDQRQDHIDEDAIRNLIKSLSREHDFTEDDIARIAVKQFLENMPHSRAWYRINATRTMTGGHKLDVQLDEKINQKLVRLGSAADVKGDSRTSLRAIDQLSKYGARSVIEFVASSYAVLESDGPVRIGVRRLGNTTQRAVFRIETADGTATKGEDYIPIDREFVFEPGECELFFEVDIVDDNEWEPDEMFFVKISIDKDGDKVVLGPRSLVQVIIINDDEPGTFDFAHPSFLVKESAGMASLEVLRSNGADGRATVHWATEGLSAVAGRDFEGGQGILEFEHGEIDKTLEIPVFDSHDPHQKDLCFKVTITGVSEGSKIGHTKATIVTVVNDDDYNELVHRLMVSTQHELEDLSVDAITWSEQFRNAMNVNGGDIENATAMDYVMHFLTFGWKILFALIPPPHLLGGWLSFTVSILMLAFVTTLINDLAATFGCLVNLKDTVTAITLVALGTSLPDLFASMQAANQDPYADNSVGNVTGSNSVNVFLGLGLPWMIASAYWTAQGMSFKVPAGDLNFSVVLYTCCGLTCISIVLLRRYVPCFGGGELGGKKIPRIIAAVILILLWVTYILVSSLNSYGIIGGF